ncbi:5-carboxymethyl-2-hydroxymuconate Delta-isomerase [Streptomyces griseosporeus]|uniref:5-carboxymethyl-2-hydroxymuconate Delta-isomerase n=1 Tax=Streptomyces griseosporeus TaxID=1910 RepID=UPI0036FC6C75
MPQITVDYSAPLAGGFDRRRFALALHEVTAEIAATQEAGCKTRFRVTEDTTVGRDEDGHALVHVTIGLLPGRTDETKARLTEAVLELLRTHVKPVAGLTLHASAEVRELDASYRKFVAE